MAEDEEKTPAWVTIQLRVRGDAHAYLKRQAAGNGLTVTQVAGSLVAHGCQAGWQVHPPAVTEPGESWRPAAYAAADTALDDLPQPGSRFERDRWRMAARAAVDAAEPLIRADERGQGGG